MPAEPSVAPSALRRLATTCALLVLAVVAASAYLRLGQAGFSCADWPACFGHVEANQKALAGEPLVFTARLAHRLAAMGVSILVLALLFVSYRQRGLDPRPWRLSLMALGLTLLLALLGRWTAGTRLPAVTLGNLMGGLALLAVLWRIRGLAVAPLRPSRRGVLVGVCGLLLALQIALGGLVSARFAGPSCTGFPGCQGQELVFESRLFNPLHAIDFDVSGAVQRPAGLTGLVAAHRLAALVLSAALLALAWQRWAAGGPSRVQAPRLVVLVGLAYGLGVAAALTAPPLLLVFGHNLVAGLLVLTVSDTT